MSQRGRVFLEYACRQLGTCWQCSIFVAFQLGACGITDIPPNTGRPIILKFCSKACCKFHNKGSGRITTNKLLKIFTVARMINPRPSGRQCLLPQGFHSRLTRIHKVESQMLLRASCRPRLSKASHLSAVLPNLGNGSKGHFLRSFGTPPIRSSYQKSLHLHDCHCRLMRPAQMSSPLRLKWQAQASEIICASNLVDI